LADQRDNSVRPPRHQVEDYRSLVIAAEKECRIRLL
jgi:hypothetical protein